MIDPTGSREWKLVASAIVVWLLGSSVLAVAQEEEPSDILEAFRQSLDRPSLAMPIAPGSVSDLSERLSIASDRARLLDRFRELAGNDGVERVQGVLAGSPDRALRSLEEIDADIENSLDQIDRLDAFYDFYTPTIERSEDGRSWLPSADGFPDNQGAALDSALTDFYFSLREGWELAYYLDNEARLQSICGPGEDLFHVEQYSGNGGWPAASAVLTHQAATGQVRWNDNLFDRYGSPHRAGNANNKRSCTGTLISESLFLTAAHCFVSIPSRRWQVPQREGADGRLADISPYEVATNLHIVFNYQLFSLPSSNGASAGHSIRPEHRFPVAELLEFGPILFDNKRIDYAIVRLGENERGELPGALFDYMEIDTSRSATSRGRSIMIIQHPNGDVKQVAIGSISDRRSPHLRYSNVDTDRGSSGAGVISPPGRQVSQDAPGRLIGVHTDGGCDRSDENSRYNRGVMLSTIATESKYITRSGLVAP